MSIWICLSTPDSLTAHRRWVLVFRGKHYSLPIRYKAGNRFWRQIEDWLEWHTNFVDVAY